VDVKSTLISGDCASPGFDIIAIKMETKLQAFIDFMVKWFDGNLRVEIEYTFDDISLFHQRPKVIPKALDLEALAAIRTHGIVRHVPIPCPTCTAQNLPLETRANKFA
ncbi:hypothetical protein N9L13_07980, partial [Flavobacteriales bacterium]|nr:hypothetical protein [Flavobacteriales bacterium]